MPPFFKTVDPYYGLSGEQRPDHPEYVGPKPTSIWSGATHPCPEKAAPCGPSTRHAIWEPRKVSVDGPEPSE